MATGASAEGRTISSPGAPSASLHAATLPLPATGTRAAACGPACARSASILRDRGAELTVDIASGRRFLRALACQREQAIEGGPQSASDAAPAPLILSSLAYCSFVIEPSYPPPLGAARPPRNPRQERAFRVLGDVILQARTRNSPNCHFGPKKRHHPARTPPNRRRRTAKHVSGNAQPPLRAEPARNN